MSTFAGVLSNIITAIIVLLFVRAIISWLFVFGMRNDLLFRLEYALAAVTEPIIAPIRRYVPPVGGLDLSFMVVVIVLVVIQQILLSYA